jgi:hypothetical protein
VQSHKRIRKQDITPVVEFLRATAAMVNNLAYRRKRNSPSGLCYSPAPVCLFSEKEEVLIKRADRSDDF